MSSDESFGSTDTGSLTTPASAGDVKKGTYMLIKDYPCKVISVSKCKTGKHGSAKCTIVGLDIFTNRKVEDSLPSSANVSVPNVTKTEFLLVNILEDDYLCLLYTSPSPRDRG